MPLNRHALRAIRERSGLSITALAARAGVSQPHLSNLERGRRQASPDVVRRLAAALAVPVVAILAQPDRPDDPGGPGGAGGSGGRAGRAGRGRPGDAQAALDRLDPSTTTDDHDDHDEQYDEHDLGRVGEVDPSTTGSDTILADPAPLAGLPRVGSAHVQHRTPVPAPPPGGEPPEQGATMSQLTHPVPAAEAVQVPGAVAGDAPAPGRPARPHRGVLAAAGLVSAAAVMAAAVPAHANTYYSGNCTSIEHDGYTRTFQARAIASIDGATGRYIWNWYDYKYIVDPHLSFGGSSDEVVTFESGYISGLSSPWASPDNHGTSGDWIREADWKGIWSERGNSRIKFHAAFDRPGSPDPHCDVHVGTV